jgi:hypothetical protein
MPKMTINQANGRINELQKEIEWLEPLLDAELADRLELAIEPAPASIKDVLEKQLTKRQKELDRVTKAVDMYLSVTEFDFSIEEGEL